VEQSYRHGENVPYGSKRSIRLDVMDPKARMACDLKTDDARLMDERIKQIRRYLPIEYRDFEIIVVRPQE